MEHKFLHLDVERPLINFHMKILQNVLLKQLKLDIGILIQPTFIRTTTSLSQLCKKL